MKEGNVKRRRQHTKWLAPLNTNAHRCGTDLPLHQRSPTKKDSTLSSPHGNTVPKGQHQGVKTHPQLFKCHQKLGDHTIEPSNVVQYPSMSKQFDPQE